MDTQPRSEDTATGPDAPSLHEMETTELRKRLQAAIAQAVLAVERAEQLGTRSAELLLEAARLRDERAMRAPRLRDAALRDAVAAYMRALRSEGEPPERALALVKGTLLDSLGATTARDVVLRDAVQWAIEAYYAA